MVPFLTGFNIIISFILIVIVGKRLARQSFLKRFRFDIEKWVCPNCNVDTHIMKLFCHISHIWEFFRIWGKITMLCYPFIINFELGNWKSILQNIIGEFNNYAFVYIDLISYKYNGSSFYQDITLEYLYSVP